MGRFIYPRDPIKTYVVTYQTFWRGCSLDCATKYIFVSGFQNWHFYLKNKENNNLQILFIYVMSANEMKKTPTTSTSKSLPGEEYVRQQFMLYL